MSGAELGMHPQRKPHAVVVPVPGQGHINPLLHLSRNMALHGFSITFLNMEFIHMRVVSSIRRLEEEDEGSQQQQAEETATEYTSAKLGIKFVCISEELGKDLALNSGNVIEICKSVARTGPVLEALIKKLQPPPTCIISDTLLLHTQDVANNLGIPRVSFWTESAACYATFVAAARGLIQLPAPGSEEKLTTDIAGTPPLRVKDLHSYIQCLDWSDFMFDHLVRPFLRTHEAACVLMNTFDALEGKAMEAVREQQPDCKFYTIGPCLPLEYFSGGMKQRQGSGLSLWAEDHTCLEWLDEQEEGSVLYVSFGSFTELSGEEIEELALGLEATGLPVLWVLRPGLLQGGGDVALPPGFEQRTEGRVVTIEWAPQLHVLAHPAIGAFFTHGGWNSILEGVAQGKPMVGLPYFGDQMLNCKCMEEEWGNGLALEPQGRGFLTRSLVESKVRSVMTDPKLRGTALHLRDEVRRAILSGANFNSFIETFGIKPLEL